MANGVYSVVGSTTKNPMIEFHSKSYTIYMAFVGSAFKEGKNKSKHTLTKIRGGFIYLFLRMEDELDYSSFNEDQERERL